VTGRGVTCRMGFSAYREGRNIDPGERERNCRSAAGDVMGPARALGRSTEVLG